MQVPLQPPNPGDAGRLSEELKRELQLPSRLRLSSDLVKALSSLRGSAEAEGSTAEAASKSTQKQFSNTPFSVPRLDAFLQRSPTGQKIAARLQSFPQPADLRAGGSKLVEDIRTYLSEAAEEHLQTKGEARRLDGVIERLQGLQRELQAQLRPVTGGGATKIDVQLPPELLAKKLLQLPVAQLKEFIATVPAEQLTQIDRPLELSLKSAPEPDTSEVRRVMAVVRELATQPQRSIPELARELLQLAPADLERQLSRLPAAQLKELQQFLEKQFLAQASPELKEAYTELRNLVIKGGAEGGELFEKLRALLDRQPALRPVERLLRRVLDLLTVTRRASPSAAKGGELPAETKMADIVALFDKLSTVSQQELPLLLRSSLPVAPQQQLGVVAQLLGLSFSREAALLADDPFVQALREAVGDVGLLDEELSMRKLTSLLSSSRDERILDFLFPFEGELHRALLTQSRTEHERDEEGLARWSIHLSLPTLGKVRIDIAESHKQLQVGFCCAREETLEQLRGEKAALVHRLQELGYAATINLRHEVSPLEGGGDAESRMDIQA